MISNLQLLKFEPYNFSIGPKRFLRLWFHVNRLNFAFSFSFILLGLIGSFPVGLMIKNHLLKVIDPMKLVPWWGISLFGLMVLVFLAIGIKSLRTIFKDPRFNYLINPSDYVVCPGKMVDFFYRPNDEGKRGYIMVQFSVEIPGINQPLFFNEKFDPSTWPLVKKQPEINDDQFNSIKKSQRNIKQALIVYHKNNPTQMALIGLNF